MRPTREQLVELRDALEASVVQAHWDATRREYIKYLTVAARDTAVYSETELHNLILGARNVLEQVIH